MSRLVRWQDHADSQGRYATFAQPGENVRDVRARLARNNDEQAVPSSTSPDPGEASIAGGEHVLSLRGSADRYTLREGDDGVGLFKHDNGSGEGELVTMLPPGEYAFKEDADADAVHVFRLPEGDGNRPHREMADLVRTGDAGRPLTDVRAAPYSNGMKSHELSLREHGVISDELFGQAGAASPAPQPVKTLADLNAAAARFWSRPTDADTPRAAARDGAPIIKSLGDLQRAHERRWGGAQ